MTINELNETTNNMIKEFVNQLGWNGDFYVSTNNYPMIFLTMSPLGKFFTAKSKDLKSTLDRLNINEATKKKLLSSGVIAINKNYMNKPVSPDFLATIIHEKFHARRMLLATVPYSGDYDIESMFYDEGRFVVNNTETRTQYVDSAQDIFLGSHDNSRASALHYKGLSFDEKDDLQYANDKYSEKMMRQQLIDEALVELMSIVAYQLSTGKYSNIMDVLKDVRDRLGEDDVVAMAKIILRHNDLNLFKWMLDPLTYQAGDIHYDYFSHYINEEDEEDVNTIVNSTEILVDDDELDRLAIEARGVHY